MPRKKGSAKQLAKHSYIGKYKTATKAQADIEKLQQELLLKKRLNKRFEKLVESNLNSRVSLENQNQDCKKGRSKTSKVKFRDNIRNFRIEHPEQMMLTVNQAAYSLKCKPVTFVISNDAGTKSPFLITG